eukprot:9473031-Pyramimonas_sp.AAC.1
MAMGRLSMRSCGNRTEPNRAEAAWARPPSPSRPRRSARLRVKRAIGGAGSPFAPPPLNEDSGRPLVRALGRRAGEARRSVGRPAECVEVGVRL